MRGTVRRVLLVLNGPPGVGKSALAARYADGHPLVLVVEIDELRRHLGQWQTVEESKLVARGLAVSLTHTHLNAGHDVIIPQYFGRRELVDRLAGIARETGSTFLEVVLTGNDDQIVERFRERRAAFASAGIEHPEGDVADDLIDVEVRSANASLRADAATRGLALIDTGAGVEAAYQVLCDTIAPRK